jgi:menaquinone-dependent protoporphyrinogen IX oxidase
MWFLSLLKNPLTSFIGEKVIGYFEHRTEVLKNERIAEIEASKSVQIAQVKASESSWKDEYLTIIFSAIFVAHFIPQSMPFMAKGWELLSKAPTEFWWVILTIVSGSFGMNIMDKFKK